MDRYVDFCVHSSKYFMYEVECEILSSVCCCSNLLVFCNVCLKYAQYRERISNFITRGE